MLCYVLQKYEWKALLLSYGNNSCIVLEDTGRSAKIQKDDIVVFPWQEMLLEQATMLRYT